MTPRKPLRPLGLDSRLRTMLQVRNLSIAKAAENCGLSTPSFETYLYGKSLPGAAALLSIAKGLGCSVDWLLGEGEQA